MLTGRTVAVLLSFAGSVPLVAHHSVLGFDSSREITVAGRVAEVAWRYPHVYLALDADGTPRGQERWLVEVEAPSVLLRLGWNERAVRAGDRISSAGAPARDGSLRMRCDSIETSLGEHLPCHPGGRGVLFE